MDEIDISGEDIVEQNWPYDGPHSHDAVTAASVAAERLVRYLNNATGPGHARSALSYPATAYRLGCNLRAAVGLMPQLFSQLATFLEHQAQHNPAMYDDRRSDQYPAAQTASDAASEFRAAISEAKKLAQILSRANRSTVHLGGDSSWHPDTASTSARVSFDGLDGEDLG